MDTEKVQQTVEGLRRNIERIEQQMQQVAVEILHSHPRYQYLAGQKDVMVSLYKEVGRAVDAHEAGEMMQGGE